MESTKAVSSFDVPDFENLHETSKTYQLWQFIFELLTSYQHTDIIEFCNDDGEFEFKQPEEVAKRWGDKKGKENMTYEKLARSMRNYYNSEVPIFIKVNGKNFRYKFNINFKEEFGYSPMEFVKEKEYAKKFVENNPFSDE